MIDESSSRSNAIARLLRREIGDVPVVEGPVERSGATGRRAPSTLSSSGTSRAGARAAPATAPASTSRADSAATACPATSGADSAETHSTETDAADTHSGAEAASNT